MPASQCWKAVKMSLGNLYQRIVVAAAAAALLVVNWFCKPIWRRPAPARQVQATEEAPEREALLHEEEDACEEPIEGDASSSTSAAYEAPKLSQSGEPRQLRDAAPVVAPEDVLVASSSSTNADLLAADLDGGQQCPGAQVHAGGMSDAPAAPAAPAASPVVPAANPVDEDYLKHLIDQELGPPKFAVRKPEPPPSVQPPQIGDEESLQALLDQSFGPPKFTVPKPVSPKPPADATHEHEPKPQSSSSSVSTGEAVGVGASASSGPALPSTPDVPPVAPAAAVAADPTPAPVPARRVSGGGHGASGHGQGHGVKRTAQEAAVAGAASAAEADAAEAARGVAGGAAAAAAADARPVLLTLSVTHGPATGKTFVAGDPSTEYKIGRLPDCSFQILDQEISGRHASLRWDGAARQWKLHDVGSLNGTSVCGKPIGRDYKVAGAEVALAEGDTVELGTVTRLRVALREAAGPGGGGGGGSGNGADAAAAALPAKRQHTSDGRPPLPTGGAGAGGTGLQSGTLSGLAGLSGSLPPPTALLDLPALGARLCVHNRLGADHKRMSQGCEDVPYWELPYAPYEGAGIICVFDGHHGSKAAQQAKEHLPAILRSKLLRRDGRTAPPLPPPPPPRKPRRAEGEEGEEEEGEAMEQGPEQKEAAGEQAAAQGGAADGGQAGAAAAPAPAPAAEAGEEEGGAALLPPPPEGPPLPPLLRGRAPDSQKALLKDTFLAADKYMSMEEGCTATLVLLEAGEARGGGGGGWLMQSANVGDSSALLVNLSRSSWSKLSEDHRIASSVSERQRLAARGHTVRTRLYGLNISRMLGDRFLKEEDLGFLAEPHVSGVTQVSPGDSALLVVASDGLWDVLPEERAAKLLLQEAVKCGGALGCQGAADLLLAHALVLRSKDDITIAVLEMGGHVRTAKAS